MVKHFVKLMHDLKGYIVIYVSVVNIFCENLREFYAQLNNYKLNVSLILHWYPRYKFIEKCTNKHN